MRRNCNGCGVEYEARRSTSEWCGTTCRTRATRRRKAQAAEPTTAPAVAAAPEASALPAPIVPGLLVTSTLERLTAAGREATALGQMALVLARRIEADSVSTGSSIASLSKEWRTTMEAAMFGTNERRTPLDELRERRAAKLAG